MKVTLLDVRGPAQLTHMEQFVIDYTSTRETRSRLLQALQDCYPVETRVQVEPGDIPPGCGWNGLGDQLVDCLCNTVHPNILYRAVNRLPRPVENYRDLFLKNSDYLEECASSHVFSLAPYESPMTRIYASLPEYKVKYNTVDVIVFLKK